MRWGYLSLESDFLNFILPADLSNLTNVLLDFHVWSQSHDELEDLWNLRKCWTGCSLKLFFADDWVTENLSSTTKLKIWPRSISVRFMSSSSLGHLNKNSTMCCFSELDVWRMQWRLILSHWNAIVSSSKLWLVEEMLSSIMDMTWVMCLQGN